MRTDSGYFAEFAILFKSLRYDRPSFPADSVSWGLTLARLARSDYELTSFPAVPQAFSPYRMSYAAQLIGPKAPPTSRRLMRGSWEFVPFSFLYLVYNSNPDTLDLLTRSSGLVQLLQTSLPDFFEGKTGSLTKTLARTS